MMLRRFVKSVNLCIAKTSTRGAGIINSELVDLILQLRAEKMALQKISHFKAHLSPMWENCAHGFCLCLLH